MKLWNIIVDFFKDEETESENPKTETKSPETKPHLLKSLFVKTDPFSVTTFPYTWDEEFFPPLDLKERKYILQEINRWHSVYLNTCVDKMVEYCTSYLVFQKNNIQVKKFFENNQEDYEFLALEVISQHFPDKAREYILSLSDNELIKWKPVMGEYSFEPDKNELIYLIKELSFYIEDETKQQINRLREQQAALDSMHNSDMEYSQQAEFLSDHLNGFLKSNRNIISKHCFDRLILEYNAFPFYYGRTEKIFKNKLFDKYSADLGIEGFNPMMGKVYTELDNFIKMHEKKEARNWIQYEWDEFQKFMTNEYLHLSEEEIEQIKPEDFNVYKLSLDFFCVILFKIYLDGMN